MTRKRIHRENLAFAGTGGVSERGRPMRFEPAFRDDATGRVERSRYASGALAPMHLMEGLPSDWILESDSNGCACALRPGIVTGFVRDGQFYTREQAANVVN